MSRAALRLWARPAFPSRLASSRSCVRSASFARTDRQEPFVHARSFAASAFTPAKKQQQDIVEEAAEKKEQDAQDVNPEEYTSSDDDEDYEDYDLEDYEIDYNDDKRAAPPLSSEYEDAYTSQSFDGISAKPFPSNIARKLHSPIDPSVIEIKPDGIIYLPEIFYRRVLNDTFGPGGWALMPRGSPELHNEKMYTREYALYVWGRFVAQAGGEQVFGETAMGPSTAVESAKSQALMRCCKDLGIASDLWNPEFIYEWKQAYAEQVWCEHVKTGKRALLWKKKGRTLGYPFKEQGSGEPQAAPAPSAPAPAQQPQQPQSKASGQGPSGAFDIEGTVPPQLKRYAGKKWAQVIATEEGRDYLTFMENNFQGPIRNDVKQAMDYWRNKNQQ